MRHQIGGGGCHQADVSADGRLLVLGGLTAGESGQPLSSHYKDQWESYMGGKLIPMQFEKAYTEGIAKLTQQDIRYAEELGYRIKLLGIARRSQGEQSEGIEDVTNLERSRGYLAAQEQITTVFTWGIANLERETSDGFVFTAHYTVNANDGTYSSGAYGSLGFERPESLIPPKN